MDYCIEKLSFHEDGVYFEDARIIDLNDRLKNMSRIPLKRVEECDPYCITEILVRNYESCKKLVGMDCSNSVTAALYICALISGTLLEKRDPISVVELGCEDGVLSSQLLPLAFEAGYDADCVCVCNTIGNESGNRWLDIVSQIQIPDHTSFVVSDLDHTPLRDKMFDIVIINGSVFVEKPGELIEEAIRISKGDSVILCYTGGQFYLEDMFRLYFDSRREYEVDGSGTILVTM